MGSLQVQFSAFWFGTSLVGLTIWPVTTKKQNLMELNQMTPSVEHRREMKHLLLTIIYQN